MTCFQLNVNSFCQTFCWILVLWYDEGTKISYLKWYNTWYPSIKCFMISGGDRTDFDSPTNLTTIRKSLSFPKSFWKYNYFINLKERFSIAMSFSHSPWNKTGLFNCCRNPCIEFLISDEYRWPYVKNFNPKKVMLHTNGTAGKKNTKWLGTKKYR